MIRLRLSFLYLLIVLVLFQTQLIPLPVSAFNVSFIIYSSVETNLLESDSGSGPGPGPGPHPSNFIQDILKVIAETRKWDLKAIRVLKLEEPQYAYFRRYDFRFPIAKKDLIFSYSEKLDSWRNFDGQVQVNNFSHLVQRVSSVADLGQLEVEGPAELLLLGEDRASLLLPQNITLAGLKRVLVGEGITVKITGAQEISLLHGSCSGLYNGSSGSYKGRVEFFPFEDLFCIPLLPVHISGPAAFIAYRVGSSDSSLESNLLSEETVELNPEKCYPKSRRRDLHCPINSLISKITSTEKLLRRLLGERLHNSGKQFSSSVKANVKASTMITIQIELERDVKVNDNQWAKVAEWRTKPNLELVRFHVMARIDGDILHPLEIKIVRPFRSVDTVSLSHMLLNVSLTKFPAFLLPPQTLTLDVKW